MRKRWADIIGYEEYYKVSDYGDVTAKRRQRKCGYGSARTCEEIEMSPSPSGAGYPSVLLYINGAGRRFLVHRLVATHFIKNPNNLDKVNHKDGDKGNNYYKNLEWCTHLHNIRHSLELNLRGKITPAQAVEIFNMSGNPKDIAKLYGLNRSYVSNIKSGRNWKWVTDKQKQQSK